MYYVNAWSENIIKFDKKTIKGEKKREEIA